MSTLRATLLHLTKNFKRKVVTGSVGPGEILLISVVAAVMFGGPRIVTIGRGLIAGLRIFMSGSRYED